MNRKALNLLLVLIMTCMLGVSGSVYAELKKRSVNLEWESVEDAKGYELRLLPSFGEDPEEIIYKSRKSKWQGKLVPGTYKLRIRSYDERSVPGDWSEPIDFAVKLNAPVRIAPKNNKKIDPENKNTALVEFQWKSIEGADEYILTVFDKSGATVNSKKTKELSAKLSVAPNSTYKWNVKAVLPNGEEGEAAGKKWKFKINEMGLAVPKFVKPTTKYIEKLKWSKSEDAKYYRYLLKVKNKKTKRWVTVFKKNKITKTQVPFDYSKPPGQYKAYIQAFDGRGKKSKIGKVEFDAEGNMRSPAALNNALMRETIKKKTPWYAIASYFLTMIDYQSKNVDSVNDANFSGAVSGTGRIGLGYQKPNENVGYFGIVDFGGMVVNSQNYTFASAEFHTTWNHMLDNGIQLTYSGGLYSKEMMEILAPPSAAEVVGEINKIMAIGLHAGINYWQPFTLKYGMQFNARVYMPLTGSTPAGSEVNFDPSIKLGALAYKRLSEDSIGYVGYSLIQDKISYEGTSGTSTGINSVETIGHYLNLKYEYSF